MCVYYTVRSIPWNEYLLLKFVSMSMSAKWCHEVIFVFLNSCLKLARRRTVVISICKTFLARLWPYVPLAGHSSRQTHRVLNRSIIWYQTCEQDVMKANESVLMPIGTSGPWAWNDQLLGSRDQSSRSDKTKDRWPGRSILDLLESRSLSTL